MYTLQLFVRKNWIGHDPCTVKRPLQAVSAVVVWTALSCIRRNRKKILCGGLLHTHSESASTDPARRPFDVDWSIATASAAALLIVAQPDGRPYDDGPSLYIIYTRSYYRTTSSTIVVRFKWTIIANAAASDRRSLWEQNNIY